MQHKKYKNTGLIFELLIKQIATDTISDKASPALNIVKKYFSGDSPLVKEHKLYEILGANREITQQKAEVVLSTISELAKKIDQKLLNDQKYKLVKEIRDNYDLKELFSPKIKDYKTYAALYCLLESQNTKKGVNPQILVDSKTTILEYLTNATQSAEDIRNSLIEEYSKLDKDLKMLTYKILLKKFNSKYDNLLPEQKNLLRELATAPDSQSKLKTFISKEVDRISNQIAELKIKVTDKVLEIKLEEVSKMLNPLKNSKNISDDHLIKLMQYYELVNELKII